MSVEESVSVYDAFFGTVEDAARTLASMHKERLGDCKNCQLMPYCSPALDPEDPHEWLAMLGGKVRTSEFYLCDLCSKKGKDLGGGVCWCDHYEANGPKRKADIAHSPVITNRICEHFACKDFGHVPIGDF